MDSRAGNFLVLYLTVFVALFCYHKRDTISILSVSYIRSHDIVMLYCFHLTQKQQDCRYNRNNHIAEYPPKVRQNIGIIRTKDSSFQFNSMDEW